MLDCWFCVFFGVACTDVCTVCDHVVAEHYHSFRIIRTPLEESSESNNNSAAAASSSSSSSVAAAPAASSSGGVAVSVRVTHDYLMECVLCGKGCDEQLLHGHAPSAASESTSSADGTCSSSSSSSSSAPAYPAAAALPSFSLSSIQLNDMLRGSCQPGSSPLPPHLASAAATAAATAAESKDADEWAE